MFKTQAWFFPGFAEQTVAAAIGCRRQTRRDIDSLTRLDFAGRLLLQALAGVEIDGKRVFVRRYVLGFGYPIFLHTAQLNCPQGMANMDLNEKDLMLLYRNMVRGRGFNQAIVNLCAEVGKPGMWSLGYGLEGVEVGAASFLRCEDWIWCTHRSITASLAKGLNPQDWFANNLSRFSGRDVDGESYTSIPNAFPTSRHGARSASSHRRLFQSRTNPKGADTNVLVYLFGDERAEGHVLLDWMEQSAAMKLPIVWVYMNRSLAASLGGARHLEDAMHSWFINGHRMPEIALDGRDVISVAKGTLNAVRVARKGQGPSLIHARLRERWHPSEVDNTLCVDVEPWKDDPIQALRRVLLQRHRVQESRLRQIDQAIALEVEEMYRWGHRLYAM